MLDFVLESLKILKLFLSYSSLSLTFDQISITPLSVIFGTVYSLQQLSLSLLNVTLGHVSTIEMDQMDSRG